MSTNTWHPFEYELKFRLGEYTLLRQRLPTMRLVYGLKEIMAGKVAADRPPLLPGQAGYLLSDMPTTLDAGVIGSQDGLLRYCLKAYRRCYIDMSGSFDQYQSKFSPKTRSSLKRKVRRLRDQAGSLEFRRYTTPSEMDEFFALARPVSALTYQERLLDCGLPEGDDFRRSAADAAAQDRLRAFVLMADGQAISYLYCPDHDGVLEYAYLGYRPEHARLSPGTVLQWLALESLFEEQRFAAFDFTEGESEHKRLFSTNQVACSVVLMLRPTLSARLNAYGHRTVDGISAAAGRWLEERGLKSRVRALLRTAA